METPCFLSGTSRSCTAPGLFGTDTIRLTQSLPVASGAASVCGRQTTAKRVRLKASSWIAREATCRPNSLPARSLAIAAQAGLVAASRAPSALLAAARRSAWGKWVLSQSSVSYTHLRAHETDSYLVCRLLL